MQDAEIAWWPSDAVRRDANWTNFVAQCGLPDYGALAARASSEPEWYWRALSRWLGFRFRQTPNRMLDLADGVAHPRWCLGGTANLYDTAVGATLDLAPDRAAVIWEGEEGDTRSWTYADLDREAGHLAAGLARLGLEAGDVVGFYLPMLPETMAAFMACLRLGCVTLPLFSGFGGDAVAQRLAMSDATVVLTVDGTRRRGQDVAMKPVLDEALRGNGRVRHIVVLDHRGLPTPMTAPRDVWWHAVATPTEQVPPPRELPAEHTALVMYTSGTTGRPKGAVHTHCGLGMKLGQDARLTLDMKAGDRLLWPTDFGWFGGTVTILGSLLAGATLVIAEGAPTWPEPDRLPRLIAKHRVTHFGTAPTLARMLRRDAGTMLERHDLSSIRAIPSSGEAWDRETWLWVMQRVGGGRAPILNFSGGTEMCAIVASNILFPQKPCSFNGAVPGTGGDIVDPSGRSVAPGEVGELVMREACIGTTRGLWRDEARYIESYWTQIPGMWVQGDLASRDADGFWFLHGRSDDTMKVAGKRIGPTEIEEVLLASGTVTEAAAVGVPDPVTGSAVVCVAVAAPGQPGDDAQGSRLADAVAAALGKSFRPSRVLFVADLPKTRSMKVMRRLVRATLTGQAAGDLSSLVNPEAVRDLARHV
ncbi:AMP-binding protein [Roseomonas sp. PWR1]|uniref:acetate--CoA ligase n=1 Tax=Roseomonas nitratireducens TaxID=2820810 RepID=A0ABS4AVS8_9PROT|nr:AMP-binding protein [Neoroseomonas nitratireducens]MBP0465412.1 AMP-binding protein [Neoroseomonas nitratireducens]